MKKLIDGVWNYSAFDTDKFIQGKIKFYYSHFENIDEINKFKYKSFEYYNFVIKNLTFKLNAIHKVNYDQIFWQTLVGPWLFMFIQFLYDKYLIIKNTKDNIEVESKIKFFFVQNFDEFYKLSQKKDYNEYIFNQIINFLNNSNSNFEKILEVSTRTNILYPRKKSLLTKIKLFLISLKKEDLYRDDIKNFNLPLDNRALYLFSNKKRNLFENLMSNFKILEIREKRLWNIRKEKISKEVGEGDIFLQLLNSILLNNLPSSYLENFQELNNFHQNQISNYQSYRILVRSAVEINDNIRFLISHLRNKRNKIIAFQEGGIGKSMQQTEFIKFSKLFCDDFYVWSKKEDINDKIISCTKTSWVKNFKIQDNKILIVLGSVKPFFFSLYESSLPNFGFYQTHVVTELIDKLTKNFNPEDIILRLHNDNGFKEMEFYNKRFQFINIQDRSTNPYFYNLLNKSRIKIFTSDYTANMQSYIINHPTVFLWNNHMLIENPKHKELYNLLEKQKMLFRNVSDCYNHILSIYKNPNDWWFCQETQNLRKIYLETFCPVTKEIDKEILENVIFKKDI